VGFDLGWLNPGTSTWGVVADSWDDPYDRWPS